MDSSVAPSESVASGELQVIVAFEVAIRNEPTILDQSPPIESAGALCPGTGIEKGVE